MAHFQGLCHGSCALGYVGGIFNLRKLEFRGLKGQFDVKITNFRGLIPKIGYFRPILTSRTQLWPIFRDYAMGVVPQGMLEGFLSSDN